VAGSKPDQRDQWPASRGSQSLCRALNSATRRLIQLRKDAGTIVRSPWDLRGFRPKPRPLPKDGRKDGRGTSCAAPATPATPPKIVCDNALTDPESGLYCAPLAALAAKRRAAGRPPKKATAKVDGRWQTAILPPPFQGHAATRVLPPKPKRCGMLFKNSAGNLCGDSCQ
jgi:hypothetical protein